jgi:hypothetical protein
MQVSSAHFQPGSPTKLHRRSLGKASATEDVCALTFHQGLTANHRNEAVHKHAAKVGWPLLRLNITLPLSYLEWA